MVVVAKGWAAAERAAAAMVVVVRGWAAAARASAEYILHRSRRKEA